MPLCIFTYNMPNSQKSYLRSLKQVFIKPMRNEFKISPIYSKIYSLYWFISEIVK